MIIFRSSKVAAVKTTIKLLADYHAVSLDNPDFRRQYRHLFAMLSVLDKDNSYV